jgi:hypothetical protein
MAPINLTPKPCRTCGQPVLLEPHALQWIDQLGNAGCWGNPNTPHTASIDATPSLPIRPRRRTVLIVALVAAATIAGGAALGVTHSSPLFGNMDAIAGTTPTTGDHATPGDTSARAIPSSPTAASPSPAHTDAPVLCDPEVPSTYCFPRTTDPHAALGRLHGLTCGTPPPLQQQVESASPDDGTDVEDCHSSTTNDSVIIGYNTDNFQENGTLNDIHIEASASGPAATFQDAAALEAQTFTQAIQAFWPDDAPARTEATQAYQHIIARCNTSTMSMTNPDAASAPMPLGYVVSCAPASPITITGQGNSVTTITIIVDIEPPTPG